MASVEPKYRKTLDELKISDSSWLNLGDLRRLVAKADELDWSDTSLISHGSGSDHITRRDVRCAKTIVIEGGPRG